MDVLDEVELQRLFGQRVLLELDEERMSHDVAPGVVRRWLAGRDTQ